MPWERGLSFDQWKTISESMMGLVEPITISEQRRAWLLVKKLPRINVACEMFATSSLNLKEVSLLPWQNNYSNVKITFHMKQKFLLLTNFSRTYPLWNILCLATVNAPNAHKFYFNLLFVNKVEVFAFSTLFLLIVRDDFNIMIYLNKAFSFLALYTKEANRFNKTWLIFSK